MITSDWLEIRPSRLFLCLNFPPCVTGHSWFMNMGDQWRGCLIISRGSQTHTTNLAITTKRKTISHLTKKHHHNFQTSPITEYAIPCRNTILATAYRATPHQYSKFLTCKNNWSYLTVCHSLVDAMHERGLVNTPARSIKIINRLFGVCSIGNCLIPR